MSETREARLNIRRMDTASAREFWEFVQRSVAEWEQQRPEWSREIASPEATPEPPTPEPCEGTCNPHHAQCGAKFCTYEDCVEHERECKAPKPEPERPAARCVWTEDDFGYWNTGCGKTWQFTTDGPAENKCRFCFYCGQPLVVEP